MNELTVLNQLPQSKYGKKEVFDKMASGASFLPIVKLFSSNSKPVKKGEIGQGHYGIVEGQNITDLGDEFDCLVLSWRPKALDFDAKDGTKSYFNPEHPEFLRIEAKVKSKAQNPGCVYGPEYLIYIPAVNKFAVMMFNNETMRNRAPLMSGLIGRGATLGSELIENKKDQSWHGPVINQCSNIQLRIPEEEFNRRVNDELPRFNNPPEESVEEAASMPASDRER